MQLNPIKRRILETLKEKGKPATPLDIARQLEIKTPQAMMHLLNLKGMGYVSTPEKNHYAITDLGKEALGTSKSTKSQAPQILNVVPHEQSFHFYTAIGHYTGTSANSLQDFCEKIQKITPKSIEFHMARKDFENWISKLGDEDLAKKLSSLREQHLSDEELRKQIYETTRNRCEELKHQTVQ